MIKRIEFAYHCDFRLHNEIRYSNWLHNIALLYEKPVTRLEVNFVTDAMLLDLNLKHLNHDYLTDIITFDYSNDYVVDGEIFISIERVEQNAAKYKSNKEDEVLRVMSHGLLHILGYSDGTKEQRDVMREKEEECIKMFHVEQ